jgi:hypothetical protein
MSTRPPFPAVIDSSLMAAFKSCPKKAFYEFIEHWKPVDPSVHLHAGAAYAAGLEAARTAYYVNGDSPDEAIAQGITALLKHYGDFECPSSSAKSAERMAGALEYYFSAYPLDQDKAIPLTLPGGKRGIEFSFLEPLDILHPEANEPLLYSGRMDMMVAYDGMKLGEDDKTTSQLGASWPRQWDNRCFHPNHEVLTRNGWKYIADITIHTEIMQSDAEGNLSFTVPTERMDYTFNGNLLEITGRRLSQFVTKNHRVLLNKRRGGNITVLAENLQKQDHKCAIPLAGRHTEERLPPEIQRFVAAVQADATLRESKGIVTAGRREHMPNRAIVFSFTKERKVKRLLELLKDLNIVDAYKANARNEFYISGFTKLAEVVDMLLDENKEFKEEHAYLFDTTFLDELEHWDGWANQYYTNSEKNAKFVATVAALNDRAASTSCDAAGHWTVVLSNDTERTLNSVAIKEQPYSGRVFCVTVPAGYILTRHHGAISISGNSQFTGYVWGAQRAGIKLDGFLIRGVSILKSRYDTLQAITYRPQWMIERWHEQLHKDLRRMIQMWEEGYWDYNLDHACAEYGGCPFRAACQQRDPSNYLDVHFQRRKWDPVTRTETPL